MILDRNAVTFFELMGFNGLILPTTENRLFSNISAEQPEKLSNLKIKCKSIYESVNDLSVPFFCL